MNTKDFIQLENKDGNEIMVSLPGALSATATNYGVFFIAQRPIEIVKIKESHTTAGSNAGVVTLQIEKLTGTEALDAGSGVLKTAFNLKGTANTVISYSGYAGLTDARILKEGDRLALKDSGTLTDLAGVCVTIYYKYANNGHYRM
ncbi:MAG: hypothetical protein GX567_08725 [Clostridia bacterium]|jgi:hypothetical protein|nr:hypothetical protein [Clostridia bacterium]